MSSELDSLITVGHDMWAVSHVPYFVLTTDMKPRASTSIKVVRSQQSSY